MAASQQPHLALLPSAGMGHLSPFCRLATALAGHGCAVSFISAQPTVSIAESERLSALLLSHPSIRSLPFPLVDLDASLFPPSSDPFYLRYEAIRRSSHLLSPLLSSSPFSALVVDIGLASAFIPIAKSLHLPVYILFTTSAAMLAFYAYFPTYSSAHDGLIVGDIDVPGLGTGGTVPKSWVVPGLLDPDHFFTHQFLTNSRSFPSADGILVNTFEALERDAIVALNGKRVIPDLCPVLAIGPLMPMRNADRDRSKRRSDSVLLWLDTQPQGSVVYVSFGSRTAMSKEQIRELGIGLEKSQCRFLWVIKTKKVDREEELLGKIEEAAGEVKGRGLVVNGWVEQEEVLRHRAVGGFVSHCGWNSTMEAAVFGVRMLAWPRGADQRVNGEVVRRSGLGVWMEEWLWEAEEGVVSADEIAKSVKEMMEDEALRESAAKVKEEAWRAVESGGSSDQVWEEFISKFRTVQ